MRLITARCRALLACRSPPRLSRCRRVCPDEAGSGATPQSIANAGSLRSRCRVVAGGDEQLPGDFDADPGTLEQPRGEVGDERGDELVEHGDLVAEVEDAL